MRFLLGLLLLSSTVFGQKISDLPTYTGFGDSAYVLTVVNGANRKMYGKDIARLRLDSLTTAINGKAATSHIHDILSITNLQSSLDSKQATLVSGSNIKTINGSSVLGAGDITIASNPGTVTNVSFSAANGFTGSVLNPTTTPAISIGTSVTGLIKGNGTGVSAATAGTDYQAPLSLTTTGSSGAATLVGNTLNIPNYPGGTVTNLSVVSANGLAGTVATPSTTPAITLSTTVTGLVKGNGTSLSAAVAGTDYAAASHTHAESDITNLVSDLAAKQDASTAATITGTQTLTNKTIDGTTNTLQNIPQTAIAGLPDLRRVQLVFNEFLSSSGLTGIGSNASGTGASWGASTATSDHPGIGQFTTGTTATGRVYIASGTTPILFGNSTWESGAQVRTNTLSNSTERYAYISGFADVVTAENQVDGAYFLYDEGGTSTGSAASGNWQCVTSSNSTRTFTTTSVTLATNTWYKLQVKVNADGTSVDFLINDAVVATHTTNIPTGAGRNTGWVNMMGKSVGTTSRTFDIDYTYLYSGPFTTTR